MTTTTRTTIFRLGLAAGAAFATLAIAGQASACAGAGVVTRIDGNPASVSIKHADGGSATVVRLRPACLDA